MTVATNDVGNFVVGVNGCVRTITTYGAFIPPLRATSMRYLRNNYSILTNIVGIIFDIGLFRYKNIHRVLL